MGETIPVKTLAEELKLDTNWLIDEIRREGLDVDAPSNSVSRELAEKIRSKCVRMRGEIDGFLVRAAAEAKRSKNFKAHERTTNDDVCDDEANIDYEAAIDQYIAEMERIQREMIEDQREIIELQSETRTMLVQLIKAA
ncbi:MAG TPA: hypothetical protein VGN86_01355 [Pyrinomonadaceae bacterium]|nr:hypothetical protein [Pyrinomonadaceae bacterium]